MSDEHKRDDVVLFAAANSGRGFANFYDDIFDREEITRRYLIKGGPGTGKSTLMRRAASEAESKGFKVEYYKCSSDPDSLDAVIIGGRVAIMDATAPHSLDASLPGIRDEIVDLGRFWSSDALVARRREIEELVEGKSSCYRGAYRLLSAAMSVDTRNREIILPYLKRQKMRKAVQKLAKKIPNGNGYRLTVGICDSIGMKGRVHLDTFEKNAEKLYLIEDMYGLGSEFLSMMAQEAVAKGNSIRVSYSPLDTSRIDALSFEESGTVFVIDKGGYDGIRVGLKRFIDTSAEGLGADRGRQAKKEYRFNLKLLQGLIRSASDRLAEAGEYHFRLEDIYKKYMDFEKLELFSREFISEAISAAKK